MDHNRFRNLCVGRAGLLVRTLLPVSGAAALLSACAGQTDWPSLADPLPGPEARSVVLAQQRPVAPARADALVDDYTTAAAAAQALRTADADMAQRFQALSALAVRYEEGRVDSDLWGAMQIAITRASTALSAYEYVLSSRHLSDSERRAGLAHVKVQRAHLQDMARQVGDRPSA